MPRQISRLNALTVSKAKKAGMYADGGGLYLQVSPSGTKSWIFRFALNGREREMGLGPLLDVPLIDARDKAAGYRKQKRDGIDPIEARKRERRQAQLEAAKAISFKDAAEAYLKAHAPGWRNVKHADQWRSTLKTYAYPAFGALAVQDVDVGLSYESYRTNLGDQDRDSQPPAGPDRVRPGLGDDQGPPARREPCPLARPLGKPSPNAVQGAWREPPCSIAVRSD